MQLQSLYDIWVKSLLKPGAVLGSEQEHAAATVARYAAVPFVYNDPQPEEPGPPASMPLAPASAPVIADIPFTPSFAVPASVRDHLPDTLRMHKVHLQGWLLSVWLLVADRESVHQRTAGPADHASDCQVCAASWGTD